MAEGQGTAGPSRQTQPIMPINLRRYQLDGHDYITVSFTTQVLRNEVNQQWTLLIQHLYPAQDPRSPELLAPNAYVVYIPLISFGR